MLSNVIIDQYTQSTNLPEAEAFEFLVKNRRKILNELGKPLFKEMILNYRTYYKTDDKQKIIDAYKTLIMAKPIGHTSDMAIGYNIIKYVKIDQDNERDIIDFMYERLGSSLPQSKKLTPTIKKHFVMSYIENNVLIKKRT